MSSFLLGFREVDKAKIAMAGGKGANLGELTKIEGINVPEGFCISTEAYKEIIGSSDVFKMLLEQLAGLKADERTAINDTSAKIRMVVEETAMPKQLADDIARRVKLMGERCAYAVRSSATAEDLPTASFAGQQDTYLNIIGPEAILRQVSKCWASLFTERAILYRLQHGFDHRKVLLSVIVQKMIFPDASGILFTADPVASNRKVLSIDAGFGLGEALVSGLVNADTYKVANDAIIDKRISEKKIGLFAAEGGGTMQREISADRQSAQALTDDQVLTLARIGRKIEACFGMPQDIEWCLSGDTFYMVQSRPITTLFPIPPANDHENHVYISVGHQQMMTDAMKPLGLSVWQLTTSATMQTAGGRLFVDIAPMLVSQDGRNTMINVLGKSDPLIKDALIALIEREDFIKPLPDEPKQQNAGKAPPMRNFNVQIEYDPALVPGLIGRSRAAIAALKQSIQTRSGVALFNFILEDIRELKKSLSDPQSFNVFMTAANASSWINEKMLEWLGEKNAADRLTQSVPDNITSEMGLALLDVADVIRPYPEVINYLQQVKEDDFREQLTRFNGGQKSREAIDAFLDKYGMRCAGEIDITKPRWSEKPATIVSLILTNIKSFEAGAGKRKFEQGLQEALEKEQELLGRVRQLEGGEQKVEETQRMIALVRNFSGYREYPKYAMICRYYIYKQALMKEAGALVKANIIRDAEDIFYLTFEEVRDVVRTGLADYEAIDKRKEEYKLFAKLTPPRVMTSDGEVISGQYKREELPKGAIAGLAVSSGVVEGRAHVLMKMEDAQPGPGDILVTKFTDPSWTPLFLSIKGLVTEVGGLMTHGAVIAREYGLPAVVGVENATKLIKDGQYIRVNGTEGYVIITGDGGDQ